MWKRVELIPENEYVLNLCQDGTRFCRVAEKNSEENSEVLVFKTQIIPNELIEKYEWDKISAGFTTQDGKKFYFGPHGEWFIDVECEALENDEEEIPWVTPEPPKLAPK